MEETKLLEFILVADVLLLSKQIDAEKRAKGTNRIGGDYVSEAVALVKERRSEIIAKLVQG